jgi:hypothetical protein
MQPSKGKSLILLKLFNHLLQQTSHVMVDFESSTDTLLLRARIHLFITEWFKLNDMSGVNLRGEYSEMRQRWPGMDGDDEDEGEENEGEPELEMSVKEGSAEIKVGPEEGTATGSQEAEGVISNDGEADDAQESKTEDKETNQQDMAEPEAGITNTVSAVDKQTSENVVDRMDLDGSESHAKTEEKVAPVEPEPEELYTVMYHLQAVFANPPSLVGPRPVAGTSASTSVTETPMQAFKRRTGVVLNEMSNRRGEAIEMAKSMREAALAGIEETDLRTNEYPAFLVSRRTLEADVSLLPRSTA